MAPRASSRTRGKSPATSTPTTPRKTRHSLRTGTPLLGARPPLPLVHANELLKSGRVKVHPVKEQTLHLEHENILIYRQKVPTPKGVSGHIIRRTDTNAVSASSLFRCAFPTASTKQEEEEMEYITSKYETEASGRENEPDNRGRLTGKWVPCADARILAEEYELYKYCADLFDYAPAGADTSGPATDSSLPEGTNAKEENSVEDTPPPRASKRQRRQSLAVAKAGVTVEQTISTDPKSGAVVEATKVTIDTPKENPDATVDASQEQKSLEAIESAKELVEQLKEQHVLQTVPSEGSSKKRTIEEVEEIQPVVRRGWFGRHRTVRPVAGGGTRAVAAPPRRLLAYVGLAVVGAATAAVPFFL